MEPKRSGLCFLTCYTPVYSRIIAWMVMAPALSFSKVHQIGTHKFKSSLSTSINLFYITDTLLYICCCSCFKKKGIKKKSCVFDHHVVVVCELQCFLNPKIFLKGVRVGTQPRNWKIHELNFFLDLLKLFSLLFPLASQF